MKALLTILPLLLLSSCSHWEVDPQDPDLIGSWYEYNLVEGDTIYTRVNLILQEDGTGMKYYPGIFRQPFEWYSIDEILVLRWDSGSTSGFKYDFTDYNDLTLISGTMTEQYRRDKSMKYE